MSPRPLTLKQAEDLANEAIGKLAAAASMLRHGYQDDRGKKLWDLAVLASAAVAEDWDAVAESEDFRSAVINAVSAALHALPGVEIVDSVGGWVVKRGDDTEFVEV